MKSIKRIGYIFYILGIIFPVFLYFYDSSKKDFLDLIVIGNPLLLIGFILSVKVKCKEDLKLDWFGKLLLLFLVLFYLIAMYNIVKLYI